MMLAMAEEADVLDHDDIVKCPDIFQNGALQGGDGVLGVAREVFIIRFNHALWRFIEARAIGIIAAPGQQDAYRCLRFAAGRALGARGGWVGDARWQGICHKKVSGRSLDCWFYRVSGANCHNSVVARPSIAYYITYEPEMQKIRGTAMSSLNEIYNSRILELAADIARTQRLANPSVSATAHSKLCGSTIAVDLLIEEGKVIDFGQTVKACLLGQAAASVVGREIVGSRCEELRALAKTMRDMLKADGSPPEGRWADLAVLQPVKDYKARHASTMLVFDAVVRALDELAAAESGQSAVVEVS